MFDPSHSGCSEPFPYRVIASTFAAVLASTNSRG
jgi:hypothetical protein